ncbi:Uncharacterised protein [Legionella steigerwaltii]|uniref:Uncharacterized protein n=1 Tax=Legionella steigerwaltii TaxID=460 RepID=A0A378LBK1_9GAMM|nr:hypothetical protein [Legionella steigerwaltii]KTD78683.1 hypothetical protein Lstg_1152 [Legionella steigerwaltii]STY24226.1 Uncharacterised protein [Legionella steigerwaltii]
MLRLRLARHIIEEYQDRGIVHRPDFLIYDFDEIEYQTFWQEIASSPRKRLYTDGVDVFRVNWLRHLFESFKGWLGFENHCHPNRVEMTLGKIAYAGYVKGFKAPVLQQGTDAFPISSHFIELVNSPRTNQISSDLQHLLMSYFITHSYAFPEFNSFIHRGYPFGQTFIQEYLAHLAPSIDPQDDKTVQDAICQIRDYGQLVNKTDCFQSSPFAEAYAEYLAGQEQYQEALEWSPEVKKRLKESFIEFYLTQEQSDPQALKMAVELIAALFLSTIVEDQQKAIDYIKANFNYEEQAVYLVPYPELRTQVAKAYLEDAKREKGKWSITKMLMGNQTIEFLAQAVRLHPPVLGQDDSLQDLLIKEEWLLYQFDLAIDSNRFQDADELYIKNPDLKYNKSKLECLREHYLNQFYSNATKITEALLSQNIETTTQLAEEQIELAKKIVRIRPQDSLVMKATINYASTLLAVDVLKNSTKDTDRKQLNKAQHRLNEYLFLSNNTELMEVYNKLSLRKIYCLIARLAVPINYNDCLDVRIDFVKKHMDEIKELKKELKLFISINEKQSKESRQTLAKMYYLLADTLVYFEEKKQKSIPYFKKATELMPENLYYSVRYFELVGDKKRHVVREKINAIAHLHGTLYQAYMVERWGEDKIMSNGFDIHAIPQDDSFLGTLGRRIGYI